MRNILHTAHQSVFALINRVVNLRPQKSCPFAVWFIRVRSDSFCRWKSCLQPVKASVLHHGIEDKDNSTSLKLLLSFL